MAVVAGGGGRRDSSAAWWPGLEVPDATEMDPAAVRSVAEQLDSLRTRLIDGSKGTLDDVTAKSTMVVDGDSFGKWETARQVLGSYLEAHEQTADCYQMLIDQLAMAAETLRVEADEFEGVDAGSAARLGGEVEPIAATPGMS